MTNIENILLSMTQQTHDMRIHRRVFLFHLQLDKFHYTAVKSRLSPKSIKLLCISIRCYYEINVMSRVVTHAYFLLVCVNLC